MESEGRIELLVMKYSNQSQKDEKKVNNQLDKFVWLWYIFWKYIVPWRSLEENIWWSSKYKQKYFWNQSLPDVPNLPFGRWCGPVTIGWTSFWRSITTFVHIHFLPLIYTELQTQQDPNVLG